MSTDSDRRRQDVGNVPNRRNGERRKKKNTLHLFRRSADPSLWLPGVITIVGGSFIVWSVVELSSVQDLRVSSIQHSTTVSDHENRIRMLEAAVNGLLLNKRQSRGTYMATSSKAGK